MKKKIGIAIMGGTGYGAGELLRCLCQHPEAQVAAVTSSSSAGTSVSAAHPHLRRFYELSFEKELDFGKLSSFEQSVIFTALPHGTSAKVISSLLPQAQERGTKIIDLSGDLRLRDQALRKEHYPETEVEQAVVDSFVFGLTELYRSQIASAQFVTNPGCLASGCILAAAPLVASYAIDCLHLDAKTGSSGAGKTPQTEFHHPELHGNTWAYKVLSHRHEPEIMQALSDCAGKQVSGTFVPHVIPLSRGIYVTMHAQLKHEVSTSDLLARYRQFYEGSPFIRVGSHVPQLHHVVLSNFCDITVTARGRQVIAISALDNLVKGMVGKAIQSMNVMCGLPEEEGLWQPAPGPM